MKRLEDRLKQQRRGPSSGEFLSRLGRIKVVEPEVKSAYKVAEELSWRESDAPHGHKWHTSFHASQFPGDRSCGRAALYTLMDIPRNEPSSRRLVEQGEVGKAIEMAIVRRFGKAEVLLSTDTTDGGYQTGYEDPDTWLTCSVDLIILPQDWNRPHVVEIKTKSHQVVTEMLRGRGPDEKHVDQLGVEVAFTRKEAHRWPELEPCNSGSVYYVSRDDNPDFRSPRLTAEFFYTHDEGKFQAGLGKLRSWQDDFVHGRLPEHPFGGKEWSKNPCQYCKFKKEVCKPDQKAGVTELRESNGLKWAASVREDYDYESVRSEVLGRWGAEDLET
jgi:hypothetical protein